MFQATLIAGPAIGGLVIARLGLAGAYLVDVASFVAALVAIWLLPALPPPRRQASRRRSPASWPGLHPAAAGDPGRLRDGPQRHDLRAARARCSRCSRQRRSTPTRRASDTYTRRRGLARSSPPCAAAGCRGRRGSVASWWCPSPCGGLPSSCSAWSARCGWALLLLAVAGAADSCSAVCRNTIMQSLTPNELRGRLTVDLLHGRGRRARSSVTSRPASSPARPRPGSPCCQAACCASSGLAVAAVLFPQVWRYRGRMTDVPPALADDAVAGPPV